MLWREFRGWVFISSWFNQIILFNTCNLSFFAFVYKICISFWIFSNSKLNNEQSLFNSYCLIELNKTEYIYLNNNFERNLFYNLATTAWFLLFKLVHIYLWIYFILSTFHWYYKFPFTLYFFYLFMIIISKNKYDYYFCLWLLKL